MPKIPVIMPQLGESIAEAIIVQLLVQPNEPVHTGQDVMEVETNKAVMSVTAPCEGTLLEWTVNEGDSYAVGSTLGFVLTTEEEAEKSGIKPIAEEPDKQITSTGENTTPSEPEVSPSAPISGGWRSEVRPTVHGLPVPAHAQGASFLSPRLKARMNELGLHAADLAGIAGSGAGGRLTIEDFERFISSLEANKMSPASSMRVAVADAMRRSWTRPIATVGLECRLDAVLEHRKSLNPKPGPALYALRALALALAENSAPAGRLIGGRIVHPTSIDVGFAVEAAEGVLVPIIREADKMNLEQLTNKYADLVDLARRRKLPAEATIGSIATITNFGTFGLHWATPIPLPEQTLVLGLGAGRKVPFWDKEKQTFIPVTQAHLTLSFDHRVLDGGAAGRLLTHISDLLANPEKL